MKALLMMFAVAATAAAATGCSSNCGSNCPITWVRVTAASDRDLPLRDVAYVGPACPSFGFICRPNPATGAVCSYFDVPGVAEGYCDILLAFTDRPSMAIRAQFGPRVTQGCCGGYPVIGDYLFVVPVASDAGIQGIDGPTDAVRPLTDAGDGGPFDAGAAEATTEASASGDDAGANTP